MSKKFDYIVFIDFLQHKKGKIDVKYRFVIDMASLK
jgi:hypothetical protein